MFLQFVTSSYCAIVCTMRRCNQVKSPLIIVKKDSVSLWYFIVRQLFCIFVAK